MGKQRAQNDRQSIKYQLQSQSSSVSEQAISCFMEDHRLKEEAHCQKLSTVHIKKPQSFPKDVSGQMRLFKKSASAQCSKMKNSGKE